MTWPISSANLISFFTQDLPESALGISRVGVGKALEVRECLRGFQSLDLYSMLNPLSFFLSMPLCKMLQPWQK